MNSLSNNYTIPKYLTSFLFAIITYLLLFFVLVTGCFTTTQKYINLRVLFNTKVIPRRKTTVVIWGGHLLSNDISQKVNVKAHSYLELAH